MMGVSRQWLGCEDYQPWERYFSSGALAPNLHKVMQLLIPQHHNPIQMPRLPRYNLIIIVIIATVIPIIIIVIIIITTNDVILL